MPLRCSLTGLIALLVVMALVGTGFYLNRPPGPFGELGGNFTLTSAQGPVSLSDFRGQAVVISFGYTHCPDVCPTGLANLAAAIDRLQPQEQQRVQPLFISVDPKRDSPTHLADYARYFHPRLIGLTGSQAAIDTIVEDYGAFYRFTPLPESEMDYGVDHSSRLYLLDTRGQVQNLLYHNTPATELAEALRALL